MDSWRLNVSCFCEASVFVSELLYIAMTGGVFQEASLLTSELDNFLHQSIIQTFKGCFTQFLREHYVVLGNNQEREIFIDWCLN